MTISLRLNENEQKKLEQMKQHTGLSATAIIKKCLFESQENCQVNKNIPMMLGRVSTKINLMKDSVRYEDFVSTMNYIGEIEKGVDSIWQLL